MPHRQQTPEDISPGQVTHRPGIPLDDQAAYAWLEYLAVQQGASEALLLNPEERRQTPPEWVHTTGIYSAPPGDSQVVLMQGRLALGHGDIPQALSHYNQLIRSQQKIPEVLQDLIRAQKDFPADMNILQALGDSHLRLDHFQQAMEAYALAEKLLHSNRPP